MGNIFEQPWLLLIVSAAVLPAVFIVRAVFPQRFKWLWLLPILLAVLAFALDYFVRTDAEKVRAVLARAARAVEKENPESMAPLFSDDYRDSFHSSREALLSNCKWWLSQPIIKKNILGVISLKVGPPKAEAVFTVRVVFDPKGPVFEYRKLMLFKLRADFRKQGGGWFFTRVEVLEIDLHPADWQHIQSGAGEIF
jgi:hypothetical protein